MGFAALAAFEPLEALGIESAFDHFISAIVARHLTLSRQRHKVTAYRKIRQLLASYAFGCGPLVLSAPAGLCFYLLTIRLTQSIFGCKHKCLTKCMKVKMGRPRLPKAEAKGVLIGARFSPPEARIVTEAAKRAGKVKSDWVRCSLLAAAGT
jgi:hypothetical protein